MSCWIDFDMLIAEIGLHRDNAQRIIKSYKEQKKPFLDSHSTRKEILDRLEYQEAIGRETILAVLEGWCKDFKFSSIEVVEMENEKEKKSSATTS